MIKLISDIVAGFFVGWEYTYKNDIIDIITIIIIFAILLFLFKIFKWFTRVSFGFWGGRKWY